MKTFKYVLILTLAIVLFSCADDKKKTDSIEPEVKTVETKFEHKAGDINASFKDDKLTSIFAEYVVLKTALINTDATAASKAASDLMTAFANQGVSESAMTIVQKIVDSDDIEAQRSAFVGVTNAVEGMLKDALDSGKVYKQYCPMAFKNTGAYWLSESKEIANPYFGDKMYRCGRIDSIIE
ncbi:MAG: DUF3347 domain-containing protein [Bacteroidia bacterium]|nr:DUF3347 domain-containing protein [Bacteroidia bacterium]NNJ80841.1 DUF3347 domain-containing protein [Flavobacteriaceae bacterium]NNM08515.1 DUF3347 domain-containing protein [Flavobacteriaceae bacterium]